MQDSFNPSLSVDKQILNLCTRNYKNLKCKSAKNATDFM
jgi:hypothetical protein